MGETHPNRREKKREMDEAKGSKKMPACKSKKGATRMSGHLGKSEGVTDRVQRCGENLWEKLIASKAVSHGREDRNRYQNTERGVKGKKALTHHCEHNEGRKTICDAPLARSGIKN